MHPQSFIICGLLLVSCEVLAGESPGNSTTGAQVARAACARCHRVSRISDDAPDAGPSFFEIDMDPQHFRDYLVAPHAGERRLTKDEADDITSYFAELRK